MSRLCDSSMNLMNSDFKMDKLTTASFFSTLPTPAQTATSSLTSCVTPSTANSITNTGADRNFLYLAGLLMLLLVTTVVNGFVLMVFTNSRKGPPRTVNNYLVVNLVLVDLIRVWIAVLPTTVSTLSQLDNNSSNPESQWLNHTSLTCQIASVSALATNLTSTLTCLTISLHRCISIALPHRFFSLIPIPHKSLAFPVVWIIATLWMVSLVVVLMIWSWVPGSYRFGSDSGLGSTCSLLLSDSNHPWIALIRFLLDFALPLILTCTAYAKIYTTLLGHRLSVSLSLPHSARTSVSVQSKQAVPSARISLASSELRRDSVERRAGPLVAAILTVFVLSVGPLTLLGLISGMASARDGDPSGRFTGIEDGDITTGRFTSESQEPLIGGDLNLKELTTESGLFGMKDYKPLKDIRWFFADDQLVYAVWMMNMFGGLGNTVVYVICNHSYVRCLLEALQCMSVPYRMSIRSIRSISAVVLRTVGKTRFNSIHPGLQSALPDGSGGSGVHGPLTDGQTETCELCSHCERRRGTYNAEISGFDPGHPLLMSETPLRPEYFCPFCGSFYCMCRSRLDGLHLSQPSASSFLQAGGSGLNPLITPGGYDTTSINTTMSMISADTCRSCNRCRKRGSNTDSYLSTASSVPTVAYFPLRRLPRSVSNMSTNSVGGEEVLPYGGVGMGGNFGRECLEESGNPLLYPYSYFNRQNSLEGGSGFAFGTPGSYLARNGRYFGLDAGQEERVGSDLRAYQGQGFADGEIYTGRDGSFSNQASPSSRIRFIGHRTTGAAAGYSSAARPAERPKAALLSRHSSGQSVFSLYSTDEATSNRSSRISNYVPGLFSARSSLSSSQYFVTPQPTSPFSAIDPEHGSLPGTYPSGHSSWSHPGSVTGLESRFSSRMLQIRESNLELFDQDDNIFSDDCHSTPERGVRQGSPKSPTPYQKASVFMFGHAPEEPDDFEISDPSRAWCSPTRVLDTSAMESEISQRNQTSRIPSSSCAHTSPKQQSRPQTPIRTVSGSIGSIGKAAGLIVRAKRLTSRFRPVSGVPARLVESDPSSPSCPGGSPGVPQPIIQIHRIMMGEPVRFVFEGPIPTERCHGEGGGQAVGVTRQMSHLKVPGRIPNVPETIVEEEGPFSPPSSEEFGGAGRQGRTRSKSECASDEGAEFNLSPVPPRRKNASSWIAPPVIGLHENNESTPGIRIERPGVLLLE